MAMHGAAQKAIGKRIKENREKCGLTPEMLAVQFFEFCVNPATQDQAISLLLKWKAEQEAEDLKSREGEGC